MQKILKDKKGITLIALVITIIVLLILAGVSIATLTGENGILTKASEADVETRAASVEERKNLWKTEKQTDNYVGENTAQTLEELLDDLEEELITAEERTKIEETGHVVIGSKDISFADGLTEASYTITSSLDEVNFNKIITEGDIAIEKPGFTSYTIEGISASKEGEYVTSGNVTGKSGNLEIVGDINDATFKYTLTNFMQGDEIFYCKIDIDGEEHYKEIKVIQGDVVTYEEEFAGITYTGTWEEDEDEKYSDGKAYIGRIGAKASFSFYGTGVEICIKTTPDSGQILAQSKGQETGRIYTALIDNEAQEEEIKYQAPTVAFKDIELEQHDVTMTVGVDQEGNDAYYLDVIKIYK